MCVVRSGVAGLDRADIHLPKSDRLLRAAISGFCSLTKATRIDATRLDQLALPLLPLVGEETRRYAAAALSRSFPAPQGFIRRLAEEDIAISAPVLVGSPILQDIDLIGLIGRHGLSHAGAIARRANLNPNIASLIKALGLSNISVETPPPAVDADAPDRAAPAPDAAQPANDATALPPAAAMEAPQTGTIEPVAAAFDEYVEAEPGAAEEAARLKLRAMMMPAGPRAPSRAHPEQQSAVADDMDWEAARAASRTLVSTGLTGKAALFHTALADAFDLEFSVAAAIADGPDMRRLATALKAADLPQAEAFMITALAFPPRFVTTASIRDFIEFYASVEVQRARREVLGWHRRTPRRAVAAAGIPPVANIVGPLPEQPAARTLRAS